MSTTTKEERNEIALKTYQWFKNNDYTDNFLNYFNSIKSDGNNDILDILLLYKKPKVLFNDIDNFPDLHKLFITEKKSFKNKILF